MKWEEVSRIPWKETFFIAANATEHAGAVSLFHTAAA